MGIAGGAVSWGLLTRASSGWRRVFGIADQGLVAVLVRVAAGVLASQNGSFLKAALVLGPGPGVREVQNGSFLKAVFWALVRVRAFERSKNGSFLKAALVQNRHF